MLCMLTNAIEITRRILSGVRACWPRRQRLRLRLVLPSARRYVPGGADLIGKGGQQEAYVAQSHHVTARLTGLHPPTVHAVLAFAEDLRQCRKVQFAE